MNRTFQLQLLSWLAALGTLGAHAKGTLDASLFAAAVVLGTLLLLARERLISPPIGRRARLAGELLGVLAAWGALVVFRAPGLAARFPPKLGASALVFAAMVPTMIFVLGRVAAVRGAIRRSRAASGD